MTKAGIAATALVVAAAAGTAGAWYTGTRLEGVLLQSIEQANQQLSEQFPDTDLALALAGFERGWFSSKARYQLILQAPEGDDPGLELFINDHIEHGPLPLSRLTSFHWLPVMAVSHAQLEQTETLAGLFAASAGRPPVTLTSSVSYTNTVKGELQVAPLNWQSDELTTFSGLSAVYRTDTAGSAFQASGRVDSIELQGDARVSLVGLDFTLDRQRDAASGLYLGSGRLELDQLAAAVDERPALILSEMVQSDVTRLDSDGAHVELNYRIGSVSYGNSKLGSLDMGWTLSRLDPQAMLELVAIQNSAVLGGSEHDPQATGERFEAALGQLLDGHPRISLDNFSIRTANGESRFSVGVDLERPLSLELPAAALMPQLIGRLEAKLVLSKPMLMDMVRHKALFQPQADMAAVEQEAAMLAEMVAGMAEMLQLGRIEGDNILSQLSYAGGSAKLNGQPIALEDLLGLLAGMPGR